MTVGLSHYLVAFSALFVGGLVGFVLSRRQLIQSLMAIELMLLGANGTLLAFGQAHGNLVGQVFAMIALAIAAAESALALAIFVLVWRGRGALAVEDVSSLKG